MSRRPPQPATSVARARAALEVYARPAVAVDLVILTLLEGSLHVLLVRRAEAPFAGRWALPGGFLRVAEGVQDQGEDLEAAAERELVEETGLSPEDVWLEQVGAFGKAHRDPRMRVVTVAYAALVRPDLAGRVHAGGDAAAAEWAQVSSLGEGALAFDHGHILEVALARIRERVDTSDVAFALVPRTFTVPELRAVFAAVKGAPQDAGNFRRRVQRLLEDRILERAPGVRRTASKPASLYRFRKGR